EPVLLPAGLTHLEVEVRIWTGLGVGVCGYRRRGRATKDAQLGGVLAVQTGQPFAAELRAACRLPQGVPALRCDHGPPGSALLVPLLPKLLDQLICFLLTDLLQVLGEIFAIIPHGYCRRRPPT